ncbi:MAG: pyruvate ferredoxin oxidoreductase subunit gamma [Candidatus Bathyarchaeia archaeon]
MKEIRFHGRGGQGVVTAAEVLAKAAVQEGKWATSFPAFGPERRGAPVMAFTRVSRDQIRIKCQIYNPDIVVVIDPTVWKYVNVTDGIKPKGTLLINTTKPIDELNFKDVRNIKIYTIDATSIAMNILKKPITNMTMIGALAAVTGIVSVDSIKKAIFDTFERKLAESNIKCVEVAYEKMRGENNVTSI